MRTTRALGCATVERHRCSEGARSGKPAQTHGLAGSTTPRAWGRHGVPRCDGSRRVRSPDGLTDSIQSAWRQRRTGFGRGMRWRRRWTDPRVGTNTACPRGTARLAGSSRRERVNGIGGGSTMSGFRLGQRAVHPTCTPGTRRHEWTLFR
jgi:hypothetical protein